MGLTPDSILTGPDLDAWHDFARDLRMKGCTPATVDTYSASLVSLVRWLAGQRPGRALLAASRDDLTCYLTWIRETHTTICRGRGEPCGGHTGTQKTRYSDLRRFFRWCEAEDICPNTMASVPAPRGETKVVRSASDADITALLKVCTPGRNDPPAVAHDALRDTAIIQLWLEIGSPRASEIAGLLDGDVDLGQDLALIRGKGRKQRMIVLSPATARALSRYRRARGRRRDAGTHPQMFLGLKGPMTRWGISQMLDRRTEQAGLDHMHPHQFRHGSSVAGRRAGLPDTVIARLNGWSTTRMMERYGAAAEGELALEIARGAGLGGRLAKAAR